MNILVYMGIGACFLFSTMYTVYGQSIENRCAYPISNVGLVESTSPFGFGGIQVMGNVQNNISESLPGLEISAELYDSEDSLVGVEKGNTIYSDTDPGEYVAFKVVSLGKTNITDIERIVFNCAYA